MPFPSPSSRARAARPPTSPTSMPAHLTSSSGRSKARAIAGLDQTLAQADAQVATEDLDDVLGGRRVGAFEQAAQDGRLPGGAGGSLDLAERGGHLGECRARLGRRGVAGRAQHLGDRDAEVGRAVVRLGERRARDVPDVGDGGGDRRPAETRGALIGLGERPARSGRRRRPAVPRGSGCAGSRRRGRSSRTFEWSPRDARPARSSDACGRWYTVPRMVQRRWFPEALVGSRVVLRRHVPGNIAAFLRWYADPEIARLARYQATPMRAEEIERFFAARVVGTRGAGDGRPREGDRPPGRDLCLQPARRRERVGALSHHHRRIRCVGPRLRHRSDPADARPRVRDARVAPHRAVRLRVQRAGDPGLQALRLRRRGPVARVDLARRSLVGRDGDERPRVGLAGAAGRARRDGRRERARPAS